MQGLVPVDFHGDRVPSGQDDDGHVYVLITLLCRNLGINPPGQRAKLRKKTDFFGDISRGAISHPLPGVKMRSYIP